MVAMNLSRISLVILNMKISVMRRFYLVPDLFYVCSGEEIADPSQDLGRFLQLSVVDTGNLVLEELQGRKLVNIVLGC